MIDAFAAWADRHPQAAAELQAIATGAYESLPAPAPDLHSEAGAQVRVRLAASRLGWRVWRNNRGAFKDEGGRLIRFGLANDSAQLNKQIKSGDLIGIAPRLITGADVGRIIGQFVSVEMKSPGWKFNPRDEHEAAQNRWIQMVVGLGGYAKFSTGEL